MTLPLFDNQPASPSSIREILSNYPGVKSSVYLAGTHCSFVMFNDRGPAYGAVTSNGISLFTTPGLRC